MRDRNLPSDAPGYYMEISGKHGQETFTFLRAMSAIQVLVTVDPTFLESVTYYARWLTMGQCGVNARPHDRTTVP